MTQHIQYHHPFVKNEQEEIQNTVSDDNAVIFQDEKVFEESDPFKRKSSRVELTNFNNTEVSFQDTQNQLIFDIIINHLHLLPT